jgi:Tfp pilus assembly protein PilN
MNAVNLIPADRRKRSVSVPMSPLTLGVIGGLVVVLVAAVLYAFAVNDVRSRQSELSRVTANAASWQAAANSYASYVTAAEQQKQQLTDIRQLVTGRFPWSVLLSQIGGVMPNDAALSSLQATAPAPAAASAATAATSASTATTATTPTTPTTQPIQITGCAASESAVAATMVALGRVQGVSSVALASTTRSATASSSASSSSSSASGGCPFPVTFSLSLLLASPSSTGAASAATTPSPTSTTPAATPAATSATTPATGSAQ